MKESTWIRLDQSARSLFPWLVTMILVLAGTVPLRLPGFSAIMPALGLISVYHFTVRFPRLLPFWATFIIGVFQDFLIGTPPGVSAIVLLAVQGVIHLRYRTFAKADFATGWGLFMAVSAVAFILGWSLTSIGFMTLLDPSPAIFQYLVTCACYPFLAWVMLKGQVAFQEPGL